MHGWESGWGAMIIGGLLMLLFWGVVIFLVVWAIRTTTGSRQNRGGGRPQSTSESSAIDILKQRYARGEISREEYQNMRRELKM